MEVRDAGDVAVVLKEARLARGMTQHQLASRLGVSRQWVVAVEAGAPTARLGLVVRALREVGLGINVYPDDSDAIYDAVMASLR
jgi:HTH-type transcriptional regulator/antitoxin HipB